MLEVDGNPYALTTEEITKYNKTMVFRVANQFVSTPATNESNREMKRVEASTVGINNMYTAVDPKTKRRITVRYFESKIPHPANPQIAEYSPAFTMILGGAKGYIENTNMELNWYLDNHPRNLVVQEDRNHINYGMEKTADFETYQPIKVAHNRKFQVRERVWCYDRLLNEREEALSETELRALATKIVASGTFNHRFNDTENSDIEIVRAELLRLTDNDAISMRDVMSTEDVSFIAKITAFEKAGVLKYNTHKFEWTYVNTKGETKSLLIVKQGEDYKEALAKNWSGGNLTKNLQFTAVRKAYEKVMDEQGVEA